MHNHRVTHFWFGVLGVVVAVLAVLLVKFNRQFVNAVPAPRGPAARLPMFQPRPNGRVPIVTFIGCGWVAVGVAFVWVAVTRQPL